MSCTQFYSTFLSSVRVERYELKLIKVNLKLNLPKITMCSHLMMSENLLNFFPISGGVLFKLNLVKSNLHLCVFRLLHKQNDPLAPSSVPVVLTGIVHPK